MSRVIESLVAGVIVALALAALATLVDAADSAPALALAGFLVMFVAMMARRTPPRAVRLPPARPTRRSRRR